MPLVARHRAVAAAALAALRPRQWLKNLLAFAGIVFAEQLADPARLAQAAAIFVAYCAASSAAYLLNDVNDAAEDRRHPVKRHRPVARGDLSPRAAVMIAAPLVVAALAVAAALGPGSLGLMLGFLVLQAAYTATLKRVVILDVLAIAVLFAIRTAAGAQAVAVFISPWLLSCTLLLALFLALAKRRAEIAAVGVGAGGRRVLARYSPARLDGLTVAVAAGTVAVYALYTLVGRGSLDLVPTIPLVAFGIGRYLVLLRRRGAGEEPERVLLGDAPILAAVVLWALAAMIVPAIT